MAQVKIYGLRAHLDKVRDGLSDCIHDCLIEALGLPEEKRFHRFIGLADEDFQYPSDRGVGYTIIEISMFEGRTTEAKKRLIHLLFARCGQRLALDPNDLEITISETPRANWGIRGRPGDEIELSYPVTI
jgi:phenylpyruvate tautomerase PptA (4-oxalocrotonate tautomerase family)